MTERLHDPSKSMAELLRQTNSRIRHLERQARRIGAQVIDRFEHDPEDPVLATPFAGGAEPICRVNLPRGRWYVVGFVDVRQADGEAFSAVAGLAESVEMNWPEFDDALDNLDNMASYELRGSTPWGGVEVCSLDATDSFLLDEPREILWSVGRSGDPVGFDIVIHSAHLIAIPG